MSKLPIQDDHDSVDEQLMFAFMADDPLSIPYLVAFKLYIKLDYQEVYLIFKIGQNQILML